MQWTLRALVRAAGLDADVSEDPPITGLGYDSRTVAAGDLHCCIPGERADGHDFAADAAARGAAALLVQRHLDVNVSQAIVPDVRDALGPIASAFFEHPSHEMPVAAVTGTNGKTTVTYLLESIATAAGLNPGVVGTVSRRFMGIESKAARNTPEAIDLHRLLRRMRDAGVDVVVLEATSDGLEQGRLRRTSIATAGFTNLTQDHLNTHGSMETYFEAKAGLFDRSYTSRAVINIADAHGRRLYERVRDDLDILTYAADDADISCVEVDLRATGSRARVRTPVGEIGISTPLVGRYNVDNCMCALGMALQLDIDRDDIAEGIKQLASVSGRLESINGGQPYLALVDYAHTPDALEQALRACRELTPGRVIVVFGCGGDRDRAKRPLMGEAAAHHSDLVIVTSDNPRTEDPLQIIAEIEAGLSGHKHTTIPDRREAIAAALDQAEAGDVVLIAGKGHEQGQELADRTIPFDDRTVVRELLASAEEGATCRS